MAVNEKQVLDLSASGIKKLEKRDGVGIISLIVDNNELTKLENLECFPDLEKLSASGNAIVRMYHVSKCHHITHLNLPNNNLVCIEGLKELPNLVFLNLSVNNIKSIQNLQHSSALAHLDLSRNNISNLSDISNLTKLKTLHLNGNKISTLNRASAYLPAGICTLSLADNCIADLNEISYLVKLLNLEQLTISGNPCLSTDELSLPSFDYRPFVINWSLGLRLLDGRVASQKESLKAEWLYSQGKGRHYKPGEHVELIEYLCQVCPVTADQQSTDEEDEKLSHILHMQRKHKEEFLNKMSQSLHIQSTEVSRPDDINPMAQSYHFKTETSGKSNDAEMTLPSNVVPSKIMYESAPEVLFHCTTTEPAQIPPPSFQSGKYPRSVSKSEILHSSIKSPITIEQVSVEMDSSTKPKAPETTKSPYQYYEDRRVRPSSASETKTHTPKGTLIRKVSKRATSPSAAPLAPGRSKLPHSTSSKSRISPSKSCILTARLSAAAAKNSSESDTSEELGHSNRTPQRSFRSLSTDTQSGTNSPVLHQKYAPAALSPTKRVFGLSAKVQENQIPDDLSKRPFPPIVTKSMTMSEIYGKSEEDIIKAATKIQSTWRGYFVRNHNPRVCKLLQEIRFRRLEDHIQHLHGHLCRLTDFVLRQQQDLHHERELRKRQSEDIRHLHEQAKDLQKSVTTALAKAKLNVFQSVSEHDISSKDSPREGSLPDSKFEKMLPGQSSESLNLALRYSTQAFQENSGLYSPSSQTSSVTSSVPDTTFSQPKSRRDLQPSASDVSDADSGMQSMVSPNVGNVDSERNTHSTDVDHSLLNGYANENSSYASYKRSPNDCAYQRNVKPINQPSERESDYDETIRSKLNMYQSKNMSSVKHSVPLASVSSSGEESWNLQHAHDIGYINSNKYGIPSRKMSYVEFSNSSVESSPCSAFASEDCDNPLTRTINEAHVLSRQHFPPNHMSQVKLEEIGKHKSIDGSSSVDYVHEKEHQGLDSPSVCCSKAGSSQQARDKLHLHYQRCTKSCSQCSCKHSGKICESNDPCNYKTCSVLSKRLNQFAQSKVTTPLEDIDSPQSPCTVEMSGRISHSCSFQSDGFTAAEELSATATVKVFSTRAVSMTCTNGAISPQTSSQRPISLSDASPQANLRSPLVLAANVWDKKVQDIESTFHQLQTQIRDLEGTFGQIGQLGQFFYPGILQDDSKESRPALHCAEPSSGALALDMPKINFKRTDAGNNDLLFQTRFPSNVPFLPHSSVSQHQPVIQNISDCRVEEIVQEVQPLHEEAKPTISDNQDIGKSMN